MMKNKYTLYYPLVCIFAILFLFACSSTTTHTPVLTTECIANSQLNPDINGKPSPLVVVIYQLQSITNFRNADFFALYDKPNATLTSALLHQEQIEIKPNQKLVITQNLLPDTRYIAVLAAYRNIDDAQWHREFLVDKIKNSKLTIKLTERNIELQS